MRFSKMFNCEKEFMYRMAIDDAIGESVIDEKCLCAACKKPEFMEKIRIASRGLYESIVELIKFPDIYSDKKKKEIMESVYKYYVRAKDRTTPFGIFAAVGTGEFTDNSYFDDESRYYEKKILPDAGWLYGFIERLETENYKKLSFKITDAAQHDGNRVILIYTNEKDKEAKSIRCTKVYDIIENLCKDYMPYSQILASVKEQYFDVEDEIITGYIYQLIENRILISSLRPGTDEKEPIKYLLFECEKYKIREADRLRDIIRLMKKYECSNSVDGIRLYQEIFDTMKELYDCKETCQVDCIISDNGVSLDYNKKNEIEELADFFVCLSKKTSVEHRILDDYRKRFIEKFGMDREVSITEMMDDIIGIGVPIGYRNRENKGNIDLGTDDGVKKILQVLFEEAVKGGHCIRLDDERLLDKLEDIEPEEAFDSFDLFFHLRQEGDEYKLFYNEDGGAPIAGATLGRFSIHDEQFEEMVKNINSKLEKEKEKTCEIQFLPQDMRNGNVCRTVTGRDYKIGPWVNGNKQIRLKDVLIGVYNNRFYARDRQTGQIIRFGCNNMFNKMLYPNEYRFLLEIHNDGAKVWYDFPWKRLWDEVLYVPAIYYGNICISPEIWKISKDILNFNGRKKDYDVFAQLFRNYMEKMKLPFKVRVSDNDNKIMLDLRTEISMRVLFDFVNKKNGVISLEKYEDYSICANKAHRCNVEIVANIIKRKKYMNSIYIPNKQILERKDYLRTPFDKWLYFKVYCRNTREEELISIELNEFAKSLEKEYGVMHFFMRYSDERTHLRIRFGGDREKLLEASQKIFGWMNSLLQKRIAGDYTVSIYEQEIERYGGKELIEYAEEVFCADSKVVEQLMFMKRMKYTSLENFDMAVISVIRYVERFYADYNDRLNFLEIFNSSKFKNDYKKDKERFSEMIDVESNWNGFKGSENGWMLNIINLRNEAIDSYNGRLSSLSPKRKKEILYSVLHLHCNRLLGTDRELESKVMHYVEAVLHQKKYVINEKKEVIA